MRKVILFVHISLDGFAAGPNGELDWISYDKELEKHAETLVNDTDTALYGRKTYEIMTYWRTVPSNPDASEHELEHARWIEDVEKVVFSKSMTSSDWNNTRVIHSNIKEEILQLKDKPGKNLMIFGSPGLAQTFMQLDLVDEYQLTLNPIVLGTGVPLFNGNKEQSRLELLEAKPFSSGVIGLHYQVAR